jgi:ferritin-like metal-binding protein YciE
MPSVKTPNDLLATELKEIYSGERQLYRALPKLGKNVSSEPLRQMLDQRKEQGSTLMEAIDEALEELGVTKSRPKNIVVEGLIEDLNQHSDEIQDDRMLDAALLGGIQKLEHYCIAAWGTAKSMGKLLGQEKVVQAMERALEEGKGFDEEMTKLAEEEVNPAMLESEEAGEGEEQEVDEDEEGGSKGSSKQRGGRRKSAA